MSAPVGTSPVLGHQERHFLGEIREYSQIAVDARDRQTTTGFGIAAK
jgi:hypothetical protein